MPEIAESTAAFAKDVDALAKKYGVEFYALIAGDFNTAAYGSTAPIEWQVARLLAYHEITKSQLIRGVLPQPGGLVKG